VTLIDDAQNLLGTCYKMEDSIYHLISYHYYTANAVVMRELHDQAAETILKCCEMKCQLHDQCSNETTTLCSNLYLMSLRLEAAILYAKNYFKLD
jgi:hypothetical protein